MAERAECCETCRYWLRHEESVVTRDLYGQCRRRAPVAFSVDEVNPNRPSGPGAVVWPLTMKYDWCGEWEGR